MYEVMFGQWADMGAHEGRFGFSRASRYGFGIMSRNKAPVTKQIVTISVKHVIRVLYDNIV